MKETTGQLPAGAMQWCSAKSCVDSASALLTLNCRDDGLFRDARLGAGPRTLRPLSALQRCTNN